MRLNNKLLATAIAVLMMLFAFTPSNANYLDLDGNDYVSVADNNAWTFSGDFTISIWVKADTWGGPWWERAFMGHDEGGGLTNKWIFSYDGNSTLFHINNPGGPGAMMTSNTWTAATGTWYHIAVTRSGSTYTFYRNGAFDGSVNNGYTIPNANTPLLIGGSEGPGKLNGGFDEVRIWSYARSQVQIQNDMNDELSGAEPGLVLYYTFNQGTCGGNNTGSSVLTDNGPNGLNGSLNGFTLNGCGSNFVCASTCGGIDPPLIQSVPTLSQWGIVLLSLLTLSLVTLFVGKRSVAVAGANVNINFSDVIKSTPFQLSGYLGVLKFVLPLAIIGFIAVHFFFGTNGILDFSGTVVSAVIVSFIVHLSLMFKENNN